MSAAKPRVLLVGISGPSCSGKTTLARLLRDIWPNTFILHEDDFYWTDEKIPVKDGVQDWDCLESIDIAKFRESLQYTKDQGSLPPDLKSKEDQNSVGQSGVDDAAIRALRDNVAKGRSESVRIAICDGFLLYSQEMKEIWELLDVRLFLRANYATVKQRREARSGYVTLEGFWEDPPGYVDKIVWPNYVKDHAFLFKDGDVASEINEAVATKMNLEVMSKEMGSDMTMCLDWACRVLERAVGHPSR